MNSAAQVVKDYIKKREHPGAEDASRSKSIFTRVANRCIAVFVEKDLPLSRQITAEEMRGRLFNRLRSELCQWSYNYYFRPRFVPRIVFSYNSQRTDIQSIRLYVGINTTTEVKNSNYIVPFEEKALSDIFDEINKLGSIKAYSSRNNYTAFEKKEVPVSQTRYFPGLSDYFSKSFNKK